MSSWSLTADSGGSETITNGESVDIAGGTNITTARSGSTDTINNGISNNNQLTNGAGYTTNTGDITAVNAGIGMSGGGTSGSVTLSNAGVTSIVAGSNITISGSTGAVTINSSGGGGGGFTGGGAANKLAVWTSGTNIINTKELLLIVTNIIEGAEWRFYGASDSKSSDPTRCGMPVNQLLPESSVGTSISYRGGNKNMYKIRKYQQWNGMPYKERSLYKVFLEIQGKCSKHNIPNVIITEAKSLYKIISSTKISRGSNRTGIIAACVYFGCQHFS